MRLTSRKSNFGPDVAITAINDDEAKGVPGGLLLSGIISTLANQLKRQTDRRSP